MTRPTWLTMLLSFALLAACGDASSDAPGGDDGPPTAREGLGDGEVPGPDYSGGVDGDAFSGDPIADGAGAAEFASGPAAGAAGSGAPAPTSTREPSLTEPGTNVQVEAGVLTAGAWDDNLNYERFRSYRDELIDGLSGAMPTSDDEHDLAHERFSGDREARQRLDVALVIDTTGSMSDEMAYLTQEFLAISATIEEAYPDAEQRWSLVVYRDTTDQYVVRWFDFRDDAVDFRDRLAEQVADGGGDFPEAPDAALEKAMELAWRDGADVARLAFWVADAPHHDENADRLASAIRAAAELDVHLYPVASSGVDELTELSMRSAAQLTGGRYLFLTDDSGVGGAHKEPTIPCYFVTKLDEAIVRMVHIELSGQYREPDAESILRTGGDPQDGACSLDSGETLSAF